MEASDASRLHPRAQERARRKVLAPQVKSEAIGKMIKDHQLSERRACRLVELSRDSYRNPPQPYQITRDLCERIVDIAHVQRVWLSAHPRLATFRVPAGVYKRVYRLYRDANFAARRRKKPKRSLNERFPLQLAQTVNEVWSMDYVSDNGGDQRG